MSSFEASASDAALSFEEYLAQHTIEALKHQYVAFSLLKRQLLRAVESREVRPQYPWERKVPHWLRADGVALEERLFLQLLDREFERVDGFVVAQVAELRNTLQIIERDTQRKAGFDADEIEREVESASSTLVALDSFILVNCNALRRIVGLHDELTGVAISPVFLTRLAAARFTQMRFDGSSLSVSFRRLVSTRLV